MHRRTDSGSELRRQADVHAPPEKLRLISAGIGACRDGSNWGIGAVGFEHVQETWISENTAWSTHEVEAEAKRQSLSANLGRVQCADTRVSKEQASVSIPLDGQQAQN